MQDKDNNMNEWADRGWADMAALLDAEMPVRRRRRRAIWWWLPLLLLPVFAAGWFFFQDPQLEKAEPALSPVAQADKADIHSAEPVLERTEDRGQKPERESPAGLVNAGVQGTNKGLGSQHKAHIPPVASDLVEPAEPLQSALDAEEKQPFP